MNENFIKSSVSIFWRQQKIGANGGENGKEKTEKFKTNTKQQNG